MSWRSRCVRTRVRGKLVCVRNLGVSSGGTRELRELITANAMILELPTGVTLRLGRDLPDAPAPQLPGVTDQRLADLLARLDPAPDTQLGSGASDCSELSERLHLIAELFRSRHEWELLFEAPYSDAQVESLRADRLPAAPL